MWTMCERAIPRGSLGPVLASSIIEDSMFAVGELRRVEIDTGRFSLLIDSSSGCDCSTGLRAAAVVTDRPCC